MSRQVSAAVRRKLALEREQERQAKQDAQWPRLRAEAWMNSWLAHGASRDKTAKGSKAAGR